MCQDGVERITGKISEIAQNLDLCHTQKLRALRNIRDSGLPVARGFFLTPEETAALLGQVQGTIEQILEPIRARLQT